MTTLYWLALVLGGGLGLLSLFGDLLGLDGHDGSVDIDHSVDVDHDGLHILSMRSITYALFAFGAVGVLLGWAWGGGALLTAIAALATGLAAGVFSTYLFRWVSRTASGEMLGDSTLVGLPGQMVLPLRGGSGKVQVTRGGRDFELLARPFDDGAPDPESWTDVVVVDVRDGTALVSPLDEQTGDSLLPPSEPQES